MKHSAAVALASLLGMGSSAFAQEEPSDSALQRGLYLAPMASYTLADDRWHTDDGYGAVLGAGYRWGVIALEVSGAYTKLKADLGDDDTDVTNVGANVLYFPFATSAPNLYVLAGGGRTNADHFASEGADPGTIAEDDFKAEYLNAGVGNLFALSIGSYDFGIRAEALARHTQRHHDDTDGGEPRWFHDLLFNVGLQLPLGVREASSSLPPPAEPMVAVVPPVAICSDGQDNDGDGQTDFPNDLGCGAEDDADETDPVEDGDGNHCRVLAAGEPVSLEGCAVGDVIVLRGVNFDFDRSRLTANARTLLDGVAAALTAHPDIKVEIGGHTDAKGTDEYNQALSERRAESVRQYLIGNQIAPERMTSAGYGESQPVADNESDEGRELNRRVELKITAGAGAGAS